MAPIPFWSHFKKSLLFPVIGYALFGILWITLSDYFLLLLIPDRNLLSHVQTYKGWLFIIITSVLLFYLIRENRRSHDRQKNAFDRVMMEVPFPLVNLGLDGRFNYINRAFTTAYGYVLSDLPDTAAWFRLAYPDESYRKRVRESWRIEIDRDSDKGPPSHVFTICDKSGREKIVEFFVLRSDASLLVICKDITGERERELEKSQEDKMRALGQLAGGIAHDFNNQLSAIMGYAELISRSLPRHNLEFEYLQTIIDAAETSAQLTEELLTFSRKNNREKETVDLRRILEDVIHIGERTFPAHCRLTLTEAPDHCYVRGVGSHLMNMVLNLLLNARDSMPEGGTITLSLTTSWQSGRSVSGLPLNEGYHGVLEIGDEGTGIPPENLPHIFEPFFTTKRKDRGTGLGLAMVYSTLQEHRGSVEVRNRDPRGTLFRIYLPANLTEMNS